MRRQSPQNFLRKLSLLIVFSVIWAILFAQPPVLAAAPAAPENELVQIRTSQSKEVVRIVFEVESLPDYQTIISADRKIITVSLPGVNNAGDIYQLAFNDPVVEGLTLSSGKNGLSAVISLKSDLYSHKIFTLQNPGRIIIDILKSYEEKKEEQLTPLIKYTSLRRVSPQGKIQAHILEIAPGSGYLLRPVLGKSAIKGRESLSSMSERTGALAMVNASYFHTDGTIIGLLKMNKEIASTSDVLRTAFGIMDGAGGRVIIGQPRYAGKIEFSKKQKLSINAVNRERGPNELILYNGWYEATTQTNPHGVERTVVNGKVTAANICNSPIPRGAVVLSGHGAAAEILEKLKVGDSVKITETLGPEWDKTSYAVGAGPTLVQDGEIFLTTAMENFPKDIAVGRAPRTALGVTADKSVLLVVVDGRQSLSGGMTLVELAQFMRELGAREAMNLDGGGSSEMVVKDRVVNKPSDGRERRVGNGIALVRADAVP